MNKLLRQLTARETHGAAYETHRVQSSAAPSPRLWLFSTIFALVLFWAMAWASTSVYSVPLPIAFGTATVMCVAIPLAIAAPRSAIGLQLAGVFVFAVSAPETPEDLWPMSVPNSIAVCALLVVLGLHDHWGRTLFFWWTTNLVLVVAVTVAPYQLEDTEAWGTNLLVSFSTTLAVGVIVIGIGQRARIREDLARLRRDAELEQARRRVVEERARLARELHDVVAHTMSIIHMQAASAPFRMEVSEEVRNEFIDIARGSRVALGEMRHLLGALRDREPDDRMAPQPTLVDLHKLLASFGESGGSEVRSTIAVQAHTVSDILQLTIYRVAQECLSNVVRHAPGASVDVELRLSDENLELVIDNTAKQASVQPPDVGGFGLISMRERVEMLGGRLAHGHTDDGGYTVTAVLPVTSNGSR